MRNKHKKCANAAKQGIRDEISNDLIGYKRHQCGAHPHDYGFDGVHHRRRPGKDRLEQQKHDAEKSDPPEPGVEKKTVQAQL